KLKIHTTDYSKDSSGQKTICFSLEFITVNSEHYHHSGHRYFKLKRQPFQHKLSLG
ncbi:MAG: hypothetical protein ACI89T_002313, partial [Cognaticolwellia sp.]